MPPLELPANKTKSAIRDHGGNEIIMEGDPGKQQMRLFSPTHKAAVTLGNSYRQFTESDHQSEVKGQRKSTVDGNHDEQIGGNATDKVKGNLFETIIGKHKVEVGGDLLQLFAGVTHRTFIGLISTLIGGFKSEIIGGFERKAIGGSQTTFVKGRKTEIISGTTYKIHSGNAREWRNSNTDEKTPAQRLSFAELKGIYGQAKHQVDGNQKTKVAGDLVEQAATLKLIGDEASIKTAGKLEKKAAKIQSKADLHNINAGDLEWKGSKCNLNDGTLTVK